MDQPGKVANPARGQLNWLVIRLSQLVDWLIDLRIQHIIEFTTEETIDISGATSQL